VKVHETGGPNVPRGCRDPRLWETAAQLLAVHNTDRCLACELGGPCTVLSSAVEAQARAMQQATPRPPVGANSYPTSQMRRQAVGRAEVRHGECGTWRRRIYRWFLKA
jgi:hypothetical protein